MSVEFYRSSEQIREYFNLLGKREDANEEEILTQTVENSDELNLIKEEQSLNEKQILSERELIISEQGKFDSIKKSIYSLERQILSTNIEINEIDRDIHSVKSKISSIEESLSSNKKHYFFVDKPQSQLSLNELVKKLILEINLDIKNIRFYILDCLHKNTLIILIIGSEIIILGIILGIYFPIVSNLTLFILLIYYTAQKISYIAREHQKESYIEICNLEIDKYQERISNLKLKRGKLEFKKQGDQEDKDKFESDETKIKSNIRKAKDKITELEGKREQIVEKYQSKFDELKNSIRKSKENEFQKLEEKVKEWLEQDRVDLINRAKHVLNIQIGLEDRQRSTIQTKKPIYRFFGINNEKVGNRKGIIETDRDSSLYQDNLDLLIDEEDFREGKKLDHRYIYGVYEFICIFLCADFLAYYKCYWNFIRRSSVEEEICEILYDSIVSVKVKERSSTNQKDPKLKRIYKEFLSVTTMDGKVFSFRIDQDRKERNEGGLSESQVEEAGRTLRDILRQRRIDERE